MIKLVILGGPVASGKSTIAGFFNDLGVVNIDTDVLNQELQMPGTSVYTELQDLFAEGYFKPDGSLDKKAVRELITMSVYYRLRLQKIMHPAIRALAREKIDLIQNTQENQAPYILVSIPLLFSPEDWRPFCIIMAKADKSLRVKRVMERDSLSEEQAVKYIALQPDSEEYLKLADYQIDTNGDKEGIKNQVKKLDALLRQ